MQDSDKTADIERDILNSSEKLFCRVSLNVNGGIGHGLNTDETRMRKTSTANADAGG